MIHHLYPLQGAVQHYAWGGYNYIPQLLGINNPDSQPFAELWMGTHHRGAAKLKVDKEEVKLADWIEQHPEGLGGKGRHFGKLPFLFKVLDVKEMLSIQSHPNKAQAEVGFQKENELGIPLDARHRIFKDDNHKPEVMVALTDFWLLHGFKSVEALGEVLNFIPAFHPLQAHFSGKDIFALYKAVMELPQESVDEMLAPLQVALSKGDFSKNEPQYWAKKAFETHQLEGGHYDRGIFSIFFFNLVYLKAGQGIYQGAGIPHAYLEGVNVELMANSDNVFRGGLTPKHIDVPELLKHLIFDPVVPKILEGEHIADFELAYKTPAPDFQLNRISLKAGEVYEQQGSDVPQILIVLEGTAIDNTEKKWNKGASCFAPAGANYKLKAAEDSLIFKACLP